MENKLVNISSEMSAESTIADGYLKAIVAGDIIEAERKFKDPFSFRPFCRLVGATNELPRLLDNTEGFFRRAIILSFNRKFEEHEQDRNLEENLEAELSGILKWAVEGLQRLQARGKFEIPESSKAAVNTYRFESDPVKVFAAERLRHKLSAKTTPTELYEAYSAWCKESGFQALSKTRLGKRLSQEKFQGRDSNSRKYWQIEIIPKWESEHEEQAPTGGPSLAKVYKM